MQLVSGLSWARSSSICRGSTMRAGPERVLVAAERRVGHAVEPPARAAGACGISTAAPSQPQTATIAAAASANRAAAIRIVADPRGTLPAPAPLIVRSGRVPSASVAVRQDLLPAAKLGPDSRQLFAQHIGGWPAGCFNHAIDGALDKVPGNGAVARREAPYCRPNPAGRRGNSGLDRPNNSERPCSLPVCVSPPPPWARLSCCRRRPRHRRRARDPKAGTAAASSEPTPKKDGQRKIDEFAEAAKLLGGPAANPECVWLGRRVVSLMWRDDLDTAFRHLDLYDRFGCPAGHIQATFRCLVRQGTIDSKQPGRA